MISPLKTFKEKDLQTRVSVVPNGANIIPNGVNIVPNGANIVNRVRKESLN